jgi:superfamily II DNA or RNA helicase
MSNITELNKILTTKGYAIRKDFLTEEQINHLRETLCVTPIVNQKFIRAADRDSLSFKIFRESPTRFYVPRAWGRQTFGTEEANVVPEGNPLRTTLEFIGKPYEYQKAIVDQFLFAGKNGLICVPCGRGKTFMAIWTALRIGKKFLIIVDKEFLMNQWKGELEALVPGIQIGILQEDKCEVEEEIRYGRPFTIPELKAICKEKGLRVGGNRDEILTRLKEHTPNFEDREKQTVSFDCTIAMIQTLVQRDFPSNLFDSFGFTIFDECHHLGAQHFSRVFQKVQTRYSLGLSATPTRDDGLTKVFEWHLGKPVYWEKTREPDPDVIVKPLYIEFEEEAYTRLPLDWRKEVVLPRLLTQILEYKPRTKLICESILELCKDEHRRILVLSERISHLESIEAECTSSGYSMSYYIGGMKEEEREGGAATAKILLATYAMASEAMNIKTLNTVVLASPRKKVEQSTGRILRIRAHERKVSPIIVDVVDNHDMYKGQYRKRLAYYHKCKYTIQDKKKVEPSEDVDIRTADENGCLFADSDSEEETTSQ